ncbi:hypothetical protein ACH5RR_005696 [Cinchona calisaya]|uniref:Uncharacterized protein n=1 Tax=Cinchona calisaya TaxID=153742 RepID=A0ABD3ALU9_9GENT
MMVNPARRMLTDEITPATMFLCKTNGLSFIQTLRPNLLRCVFSNIDCPREVSSSSGGNVIGNLQGKCVTEKDFPGVILHDASIVQLTTAFHILAFISDNSAVSAALCDEGAVIIIHVVFINCKEAKEQHKNTKLINWLLQLHREVSPSLAACAFDLSYPYPDALGFGAVCHHIASAVACWPAGRSEKLLGQLTPQLDKVLQVYCMLDFLACLLKHPHTKVLSVGKEFLACVYDSKEFDSSAEARSALLSLFLKVQSSIFEYCKLESRRGDGRDVKLINACEWRKTPA